MSLVRDQEPTRLSETQMGGRDANFNGNTVRQSSQSSIGNRNVFSPEAQGWQVVVQVLMVFQPGLALFAQAELTAAQLQHTNCNAQHSPCSFGNNSESLKGSSCLERRLALSQCGCQAP